MKTALTVIVAAAVGYIAGEHIGEKNMTKAFTETLDENFLVIDKRNLKTPSPTERDFITGIIGGHA